MTWVDREIKVEESINPMRYPRKSKLVEGCESDLATIKKLMATVPKLRPINCNFFRFGDA